MCKEYLYMWLTLISLLRINNLSQNKVTEAWFLLLLLYWHFVEKKEE